MKVKIKSVAIRDRWGLIFTVEPPGRHADILDLAPVGHLRYGISGFMTSDGKFVNRTEAYKIALEANQLLDQNALGHTPTPGTLYSEDLW